MRAIIEVDVPDYQIGQEASIYFKDTMMIKGIVQEPSITWVTGADGAKIAFKDVPVWKVTKICEILGDVVEAEEEQEPKTGHWIQTNEFFINQDGQFIYKFICSECKSLSYFRKSNKKAIGANVCPNCGCRMVEPQESEN